jgi:uncharacterized protein YlxW (UPF0749 family)
MHDLFRMILNLLQSYQLISHRFIFIALRNTVNELREMSQTLQRQVDSLQKELDDLNTCAMR